MQPSDAAFIVLLPDFDESGEKAVSALRSKHDNLYEKIPPHITLVFPQNVYNAEQLDTVVAASLAEAKALEFTFDELLPVNESGGSYLFLSTRDHQARMAMTAWHEKLYQNGELAGTLRNPGPYKPHMTVGRFQDASAAKKAYEDTLKTFKPIPARVGKVAIIQRKDGNRTVVGQYSFG